MTSVLGWDIETLDSGWRPEGLPAWEDVRRDDQEDEPDSRGSIDPRMGTIATIGLASHGSEAGWACWVGVAAEKPERWEDPKLKDGFLAVEWFGDEAKLLGSFWWHIVKTDRLATWNGKFEKVWVMARSVARRVTPTRRLYSPRFDRRSDIIDWRDWLTEFGQIRTRGMNLAHTCEAMNTEWQPWGEGKQVQAWAEAGDWTSIIRHQATDALATLALDRLCAPVYLR